MFKPILLSAAVAAFAFSGQAFAETYKLDQGHTEVVFSWTHMGFSKPTAKFMNAVGTVTLDEKTPANSSVDVSFETAGINSGFETFNSHLKAAQWFDVAKYPKATFKSTKVVVTGADTADVTGDLTIKGVTKATTLKVKLNKLGPNMMKRKTAGFSATGKIMRSDFGMGAYAPAVSDEIDLVITAEANLTE